MAQEEQTNPKNQQEVSYVVMPNLAKKTFAEPPPPPPPPQRPTLPPTAPPRMPGVVQPPPPRVPTAAMRPLPPEHEHSSRKWIYIGGAIVLLLVLGILGYAMKQKGDNPNNQPPPVQTRLPKVWLMQYFNSETCADAATCGDEADPDADGLTNYNEFKEGTNPKENDSDKDGLADGDEINIYKTDPGLKYTDRRDIAVTNDYNDAVSVANNYDPLTPGMKMTESRKQQIATDAAKHQLHEPTRTTLKSLQEQTAPTPKNVSVFIENAKFNPENITINKGDTVIWLNKDQAKRKIASDPHPQHTGLSGLLSPELTNNQTYSFKFETVGTFGYHDHLNPAAKGRIVVQ